MAVQWTCSRVELAELLDLSQQRVGTLTKTGVFRRTKAGYDLATSVKAYLAFLRGKPGRLTDERSRLTKAQADLLGLKLRQRTGELVERTAVDNQAFRCAHEARDQLLNVPSRVSGLCAAETDQGTIHTLLTKEITQCLEGLTDAKPIDRAAGTTRPARPGHRHSSDTPRARGSA